MSKRPVDATHDGSTSEDTADVLPCTNAPFIYCNCTYSIHCCQSVVSPQSMVSMSAMRKTIKIKASRCWSGTQILALENVKCK